MFDFKSMFRRSNQKMLQSAVQKSMLISFNRNEETLHKNMFEGRTVIMVNQEDEPRPLPEPGEDEIRFPEVKVEHNSTTNQNYVFVQKEFFEKMEQEEVDEFIYQFFNQVDFHHSAQVDIYVPSFSGEVTQVPVDIEANEYTEAEAEVASEEAKKNKGESCDMEAEGKATKKAVKEAKKVKAVKEPAKKTIDEAEKLKNPRYATAQASFNANKHGKGAGVFKGYDKHSKIADSDLKSVHQTEEILRHSIQSDDGGKSKTINPAKRLNIKAIITETSEKEYITHHGQEGKDIKINVIIDRSGSMSGQPTKESNILVAALNNLAFEYPELDVVIMFSESSNYMRFGLPVDNPDSMELWDYNGTGDAEGLSRTINANFDRIKEAHVNLVYTDGSIYDEAIDKSYYKSQEIDLIGMYVNSSFSTDDIFKHYEKNSQYFTETIIRDNMVSLMNELANKIHMSKDGR